MKEEKLQKLEELVAALANDKPVGCARRQLAILAVHQLCPNQ
jgi:hypothetical protein